MIRKLLAAAAAMLLAVSLAQPPARAAKAPAEAPAAKPDALVARLATAGKALFVAARENKLGKVLVVTRAEPASEPDRRQVLAAVRDALARAAEAAGLSAITSAEADAAFASAASPPPGGKSSAGPQPADVKRLKEVAPCDAVLFALYSRTRERRTVRLLLISEERSLATGNATLAKADVAPALDVRLTQAEVDAACERINATVAAALGPLRDAIAKAGLKAVAVTVVPGRGDAELNTCVAGVVAAGLEKTLSGGSPDAAQAGAATFDFAPATRRRLTDGRKPGPLSPKDVKRLQSAKAGDDGAAPASAVDAVLGVSCGRQGGRSVVEFTLVDAKRSLWKGSATLDGWDVAEVPLVPLLNQGVLAYAKERAGEQVGNGECWTLAAEALKDAGARPAAGYTFGRELAPDEPAMPGDVMQFTSVELAGKNYWMTLGTPNHTAVVLKVTGPKTYEILHQNVGGSKKVQAGAIDLGDMKKGKVQIFRPVRP